MLTAPMFSLDVGSVMCKHSEMGVLYISVNPQTQIFINCYTIHTPFVSL